MSNSFKRTIRVDWVTFTIPCLTRQTDYLTWVANNLTYLGFGGYYQEQLKHGLYRYTTAIALGDGSIIVGYTASKNSELMVQMSGQGVASYRRQPNAPGLFDLIQMVLDLGGRVTRIDVAVDLYDAPLEFSPFHAHLEAEAGHLVTKTRNVKFVKSYPSTGVMQELGKGDVGTTLYVGKSPKQLRIYDKLAERIAKVGKVYSYDSWYRWEIQLNDPYAQQFVEELVDHDYDLSATWQGWMLGSYRWIEPVGHQRKRSRYPTASWYDQLTDQANPIKPVRPDQPVDSYTKAQQWIQKQVLPTLADMVATRQAKYIENGLTSEDAYKLACEKVLQDEVKDSLMYEDYHPGRVDSWTKEL